MDILLVVEALLGNDEAVRVRLVALLQNSSPRISLNLMLLLGQKVARFVNMVCKLLEYCLPPFLLPL